MRLVAAARSADPDPQRNQLRDLWSRPDRKAQLEPLRRLAKEADPETWPVQSLRLLTSALLNAGEQDAAGELLRRAQQRHPGDVWINQDLGSTLAHTHPPHTEEAIRFFTAAQALRPELAHELAHVLESSGRGDEAVAVFRALFNDGGFRVTAEAKLRPLARFGCSIVGATVDAVRRTGYPLPQQMGGK